MHSALAHNLHLHLNPLHTLGQTVQGDSFLEQVLHGTLDYDED